MTDEEGNMARKDIHKMMQVFLKITEFSDEIDDMVEHQSCDHQLHAGAKEEAQKGTEG